MKTKNHSSRRSSYRLKNQIITSIQSPDDDQDESRIIQKVCNTRRQIISKFQENKDVESQKPKTYESLENVSESKDNSVSDQKDSQVYQKRNSGIMKENQIINEDDEKVNYMSQKSDSKKGEKDGYGKIKEDNQVQNNNHGQSRKIQEKQITQKGFKNRNNKIYRAFMTNMMNQDTIDYENQIVKINRNQQLYEGGQNMNQQKQIKSQKLKTKLKYITNNLEKVVEQASDSEQSQKSEQQNSVKDLKLGDKSQMNEDYLNVGQKNIKLYQMTPQIGMSKRSINGTYLTHVSQLQQKLQESQKLNNKMQKLEQKQKLFYNQINKQVDNEVSGKRQVLKELVVQKRRTKYKRFQEPLQKIEKVSTLIQIAREETQDIKYIQEANMSTPVLQSENIKHSSNLNSSIRIFNQIDHDSNENVIDFLSKPKFIKIVQKQTIHNQILKINSLSEMKQLFLVYQNNEKRREKCFILIDDVINLTTLRKIVQAMNLSSKLDLVFIKDKNEKYQIQNSNATVLMISDLKDTNYLQKYLKNQYNIEIGTNEQIQNDQNPLFMVPEITNNNSIIIQDKQLIDSAESKNNCRQIQQQIIDQITKSSKKQVVFSIFDSNRNFQKQLLIISQNQSQIDKLTAQQLDPSVQVSSTTDLDKAVTILKDLLQQNLPKIYVLIDIEEPKIKSLVVQMRQIEQNISNTELLFIAVVSDDDIQKQSEYKINLIISKQQSVSLAEIVNKP